MPLIKRNSSSSRCLCAGFGRDFMGNFVEFGISMVSFEDNELLSVVLSSSLSSRSSPALLSLSLVGVGERWKKF